MKINSTTGYKIIACCFITYGLIMMIGTLLDIMLEYDISIVARFLEVFSLFLIAISAYKGDKIIWLPVTIISIYVLFGWTVGLNPFLPISLRAELTFIVLPLLMLIPLLILIDKKYG